MKAPIVYMEKVAKFKIRFPKIKNLLAGSKRKEALARTAKLKEQAGMMARDMKQSWAEKARFDAISREYRNAQAIDRQTQPLQHNLEGLRREVGERLNPGRRMW